MPAREHPNKRQRTGPTTSITKRFANAAEVRSALRSDNHEGLVDTLTTLRNQLSVKTHDEAISPQDHRLDLIKQWMQSAPGASDLFAIWDTATQRQPAFAALILSVLSSILTLLSAHYTDHALGQPVMKALLVPSRLRQLNSFIGGSHNDLIIVTLKLYNSMSNFAGGHDRKTVLEGFGWEIKSLPKLFNMRRKAHGENDTTDPFLRPDIRTLYILFLLSFLDVGSTSQIKTAFLEHHREPFLTMFKGLAHDHYSLARKVLEVCWTGLWSDSKVKRTLKVGIFNEITLGHLFKLYERIQPENDDEEHIPANLVHHFLLAICTRPGVGICFKDRGWYPREADKEEWGLPKVEDDATKKGGKVYNKILANILKTLKVNEDSRQQELAIKILAACPELVAGYWSAAALTLEPRLSSKWIANIAVFGNIISLPVPTVMFYMPNTQLYQPSPPPLSTILENILPSVGTKINFSKGLQSPSGMVQHCSALALSKCLVKYHTVHEQLRKVAMALEENEEDGQWNKRCAELGKEVRRRVPDFQVIVGFSQQKHIDGQVNQTKVALLAEAAQRLLWLYHRCLPAVVAEARFDLGKLLQTFAQEIDSDDGNAENDKLPDAASRLYRIQQLHILSLLKDSDQFVGTAKIASLPHTPFRILLTALRLSQVPAIRVAIAALLQSILSQSIIFQEDVQEPDLWLRALPDRSLETSEADEVSYGSSDGLVIFLDDCVQRCLKTPYRYVEALHALVNQIQTMTDETERLDMLPTPLIMTVLEQLDAKINNKSLAPVHLLAIITYFRNVLFNLSSKTLDLQFLLACARNLDGLVAEKRLSHYEPTTLRTVRREIDFILATLSFSSFEAPMPLDSTPEVDAYITEAEETEKTGNQRLRSIAAMRLIARLRTLNQALALADLKRLIKTAGTLDHSAVASVVENLIPGQNDLWNSLDLTQTFSEYRSCLRFNWLYIHSGIQDITREDCQAVLLESLFSCKPTLIDLSRALCLIVHGISSARQQDVVLKAHFNLLARLFETAKAFLPISSLKDMFFNQSFVIKNILTSPAAPTTLEGLQSLLKAALDPSSLDDRKTVATISSHWFDALKADLANQASASISTACVWIEYMEYGQLFDLLDSFEEVNTRGTAALDPINAILQALSVITSFDWQAEIVLVRKLHQLLSLKKVLPNSALLEKIIAVAVEATLPIGLDGCVSPLTPLQTVDLVAAVRRAESRWATRGHGLGGQVDVQPFFLQDTFSDSTAKIISSLVYQQSSARKSAFEWLQSEQPFLHEARHLIPILHAFVDSVMEDETLTLPPGKTWLPFMSKIVQTIADVDVPADIRMRAKACLINILSVSGDECPTLLSAMARDMKNASRILSHELISTAVELIRRIGTKAESAVSTILDHGLQWCIEQFAGDHDAGYDIIVDDLTRLVKVVSSIKSHFAETLMQVVIQNRISNVNALRLATACLKVAQLKPLVVNRHLQAILQHVQFFKLCSPSSLANNANIRGAIVELLHCLFYLHPHNTCQITHVDPIIRIYGGHLSRSDLHILSIFQLFESQRKLSVTPLISRWSSTPNVLSDTALEALQSLDPVVVLRTCLNFPHWRRLDDQSSNSPSLVEEELYDPVFLMLLFSHMLVEQTPSTAFGWIELFRTNVVSLFIRGLSAKYGEIRDLSLNQVVGLWKHVMTADLQEKPHVIYILDLLKDLMPKPSVHLTEHSPQLPTYTALLLMHSLRAIFNPSNLIYPITARFLLQRPTLDTADVPMLYGMLYSSSDDHWKKERGWMIKFLGDGMVGSNDWRVLKRRHTWDLLASLFQSSDGVDDIPLRMGILEILANLTCNVQATNSLILKSALLPWIEMQLQHPNSQAEGVEWTKILDNILVIVDAPKVEASTNGEWRTIICRCLMSLLNDKNSFAVTNFAFAVPVILRLASLSGRTLTDLPFLLELAMKCVDQLENDEDLSMVTPTEHLETSSAPHRSLTLHHKLKISSYAQLFSMEQMLWRISMSVGRKCSSWDKLTPRLILGRAVYGTEGSGEIVVDVAEWARKEATSNVIQTR